MVAIVLASIALLGMLTLAWSANRQARVFLQSFEAREAPESATPSYNDTAILQALDDQERRMDLLVLAVSEGIERVERSERRVRQTISSAKRRFEAEGYLDPGLEAEASLLPEDDGSSGEDEQLRILPDDVAGVEQANPWESVPGMTRERGA